MRKGRNVLNAKWLSVLDNIDELGPIPFDRHLLGSPAFGTATRYIEIAGENAKGSEHVNGEQGGDDPK